MATTHTHTGMQKMLWHSIKLNTQNSKEMAKCHRTLRYLIKSMDYVTLVCQLDLA